PAYRDVLYVEELIGPDTVDTVPPATYDAFRAHGRALPRLAEGVDDAHETMAALARVGIDFEAVAEQLLGEGLQLFVDAFVTLLASVERSAVTSVTVETTSSSLPDGLRSAVDATIAEWDANGKVRRLWSRDATLWTGGDEARWLGWLGIADDQLEHVDRLQAI